MKSMYIGSGDIVKMLAGKNTKSHQSLLSRFVSDEIPYYNAFASPIDACRTGAILEDRYYLILPDGYYPQYKVISSEMDVLTATIDFALLNSGKVIDFDELKSIYFNDFLVMQELVNADYEVYISVIKKLYKIYYNQIQEQLYCSGLDEANLVFLAVYTYEDEVNYSRNIQPNEYIKFRIKRDEHVINIIKERALIFQQIKDYYKQ